MSIIQNILKQIWDKVLTVIGVLFVLLPISPLNMKLDCCRDSGVFLYAGWRILNGALPYRDIWDHKPPVIYYLNALSILIGPNSRWGLWIIEFISLFLAAMICFQLIKKAFGSIPALIGLILFFLTLGFVLDGGNLTEEYALPMQFAALWLAFDADNPKFKKYRYLLIGLIGAVAFFTKQTSIGIWLAIVIYLAVKRLTSHQGIRLLKEILYMIFGGFLVAIAVIVFFGVQGSLQQFWSDAFKYNFVYAATLTGFKDRVSPIIDGIKVLTSTGLFQVSLIGYFLALVLVLRNKMFIREQVAFLAIGLIDLPIELILVSSSGKTYPHYYMTLLPCLALFAGLLFWVLISSLSSWGLTNFYKGCFTFGVAGIFLWVSFNGTYGEVMGYRHNLHNSDNAVAIDYIQSVTSPGDFVLLWGAETTVNFDARRVSPTRFVYQFPLYKQGYATEELIMEYLDDIIQNSPRLIIDTRNPETPIYDFPIQTEAIKEKMLVIRSYYREIRKIDMQNTDTWTVYEYTGTGN